MSVFNHIPRSTETDLHDPLAFFFLRFHYLNNFLKTKKQSILGVQPPLCQMTTTWYIKHLATDNGSLFLVFSMAIYQRVYSEKNKIQGFTTGSLFQLLCFSLCGGGLRGKLQIPERRKN